MRHAEMMAVKRIEAMLSKALKGVHVDRCLNCLYPFVGFLAFETTYEVCVLLRHNSGLLTPCNTQYVCTHK